MRFHWFLGALRRNATPPGRISSTLRRILPAAWQSDRTTKRRGRVRRFLQLPVPRGWPRRCGAWSRPPRCWPFSSCLSMSAGPTRRGRDNRGPVGCPSPSMWKTVRSSSRRTRRRPRSPPVRSCHVSDRSNGEHGAAEYLGEFQVQSKSSAGWVLAPRGTVPREKAEAMAASFGPWTLSESRPDRWPSHYAEDLQSKEKIAAEFFLAIDPLVSLSTALAARAWVWSLVSGRHHSRRFGVHSPWLLRLPVPARHDHRPV